MLTPQVYTRGFGRFSLVVMWRGGVTVARWWSVRTGVPLVSIPVGKA